MGERRQAFRREPIEVDLGGDRIIVVAPLPWERRNDFGNEVIQQHVTILNDAVKIYVEPDTNIPQLQAKLGEKFTDPVQLLQIGLDAGAFETAMAEPLFMNQVVEILIAICDVNELEQVKALVDPNSTTPTVLSGILSDLLPGEENTQKTESGPDSSSADSTEILSEISPTENSSLS